MRFPGFIGPSYTLQSVNVDCQNCVNLFPEINALGTGKEREVAALVPTPGLRLLATLPKVRTRGTWRASNGQIFWVNEDKLYRIESDFTYTELGTLLSDTGRVSIADNGNDVVIVDGSYGYHWDIGSNLFSQIVDPDFYPASHVAYLDGYFIFNKVGTQQFFISGLNDVTFDGTDISTAEGKADNLVGLICNNQHLFLFGSQSTEVFYDSGNPDFPFDRIQGAVMDVGCSAPHSIVEISGSVYWLGGDSTGTGIVYRTQGMQHQRISTPAIEAVIRGLTNDQIADATGHAYQQGGHVFYFLNLPGTKSTWVYDASTGFWHERTYTALWSQERHRSECHVIAHGLNVVGDYENGNIYSLDQDYYTDNGTAIARLRTSPHFSQNLKFIRYNKFQLDLETGVGTDGTGQGVNPVVLLQWSDDGGHSWSNEHELYAGKIGKFKTRVVYRRLGVSRDRVFRVKITDPVKVVLIGAEMDIEGGAA